ncbi:MAG: hypothetical protein LC734_04550 [Acidobacteria bacterium]|nr:hypothetical protein [Acidobacteriota bacterium]
MSTLVKSLIIGAIAIAVLYVMNAMMSATGFFGVGVNDYQGRLLVFIAINIILATSLNLINGFTGHRDPEYRRRRRCHGISGSGLREFPLDRHFYDPHRRRNSQHRQI